MTASDATLRNVSDTARWVAVYRARETERPNGLFRDPFARRLAGERGEEIARAMKQDRNEWAFITRTFIIDSMIEREIANGVDTVVNLAAGLDARPYRMPLPPSLKWIEVDLPEIVAYKSEILRDERPRCAFERVALDLADVDARRALFARVGGNALVITEGLLIYLAPEEVRALAADLAAQPSIRRWVFDIASPALMQMMLKQFGAKLDLANAPFKFAPEDGPHFVESSGWSVLEVQSNLKVGARLKRLSFVLRLLAMLPEAIPPWSRPWGGTCLVGR